jgi:hypothetical protein
MITVQMSMLTPGAAILLGLRTVGTEGTPVLSTIMGELYPTVQSLIVLTLTSRLPISPKVSIVV